MKAVIKKVTVDEHNEKLVNFAQTIDFSELFAHIKDFAKVECDFCQPEITTSQGAVYIRMMSNDITNQTGVFGTILEKCCLQSFSNGVYIDRESGELGYWVSIHIRYEHKNGGSNGMEILSAWYTEGKGWRYEDVGTR